MTPAHRRRRFGVVAAAAKWCDPRESIREDSMLKSIAALAVVAALAGGAASVATAQPAAYGPRPVMAHHWRHHHHWGHHRVCSWHYHHRHCYYRRW
jgi:hypothetical protein